MTTKTKTAQTVHGDVQYPVVECSSCGQEVRKEDAKRFVIGDVKRISEYRSMTDEWRFCNGYTAGWACEFCRDDGPIRYPSDSPTPRIRSIARRAWGHDIIGMVLLLFAIILAGAFLAAVVMVLAGAIGVLV
jgi:hypothetical protein